MSFIKLTNNQTHFMELNYISVDPSEDGGVTINFQDGLEIRLSLIEAIDILDEITDAVGVSKLKFQEAMPETEE